MVKEIEDGLIRGAWIVLQQGCKFLVCQETDGENSEKPQFDKRPGDDLFGVAETRLLGEKMEVLVQRALWEEAGLLIKQYTAPVEVGTMNVRVDGKEPFWVRIFHAFLHPEVDVNSLISRDEDSRVVGLMGQRDYVLYPHRGGSFEAAKAALDREKGHSFFEQIKHR